MQVEGAVLGCHCCETASPEHHRDILRSASVAWNPGSGSKNKEEMVLVGTYKKLESSDGDLCISWAKRIDRTVKECLT